MKQVQNGSNNGVLSHSAPLFEVVSAESSTRTTSKPDRFTGKVALLVGTVADNRSLALSLAHRGTDVAIVYETTRADTAEQVEYMRQDIEATGRRCVLLPAQKVLSQSPRWVVEQVVQLLGRLDFYISRPQKMEENGRFSPSPIPQQQLMIAAMKTILAY